MEKQSIPSCKVAGQASKKSNGHCCLCLLYSAKAVKQAIENLEKVEEKLKGKRFFGGDRIGHVDLMMGFISYMLPAWEEVAGVKILDARKFSAVDAWSNDFLNHEVIKAEYLPSRPETVAYLQGRRKELIPVYASN
ncbi:Glutathione transferase GST 23 [Sesamum angolense]|uniref:Glutathione transferase GST 23 n=1 Tax=Sesamum angolense TaxID=2727404 RepID=A0AAE1X602_9LAMI|nr:Glutathione transferase GST 23 [Sesamum angolense]